MSFSKNKDKIFKNNGVKRGFEISQDLNKLINLLAEEKNFVNTYSKNKKNKLRINIDDYFSLNNSGAKNKNRIIKKNKTEMFIKPINKCDINNNYEKISKQILTDIDNIINSIKNIGKNKKSNKMEII